MQVPLRSQGLPGRQAPNTAHLSTSHVGVSVRLKELVKLSMFMKAVAVQDRLALPSI